MRPFFLLFIVLQLAVSAKQQPMNVLVIQTDEHNFRTLGCYRDLMPEEQAFVWGKGVKVDTPHIDWIASNGAICDRYYATSPVCTPSRAALISGLYPQNAGAISNNIPLKDSVVTFAEVLKRRGYATGYAGKWHLEGDAKPGWKPAKNFGFSDNRFMFNRGHWKKLEIGPKGPRVGARKAGQPTYSLDGADEKTFTTDFLADRTIDFIRVNKDKPFCYMVAIPDPHGPNTVRAPYDTMFNPARFRQPASALAKGEGLSSFQQVMKSRFNARQMALYFGMVKCIDDNVGRILDELRTHDILKRTLIVFTSDHGDMCGELGRHNKGIPCEGSARIPFIVHAPGYIKPGTVIHQALGTVDFKPTLLGLLGVDFKEPCEGRDASGLLRSGKAPAGWKDIAFVRIGGGKSGGKSWLGAFTPRHKLVISPGDPPGFFDLEKDPNELRNAFFIPEYREEIRRLAGELEAYGKLHKDPLMKSTAVRADLQWAASGTGPYKSPSRTRPTTQERGKKVKANP
ncbi:MAG: sulfatase-like hydrolase/transferase [Verrucomicrobiales bacterium]|nr:sulfatase-like hydrolase/transferase [Verrucomicrobiales bacterium]